MKIYHYIIILAAFALTAFSYKQVSYLKTSIKRGEDIYTTRCGTCHMSQGEGISGVFPPMAKADNLKIKTDS